MAGSLTKVKRVSMRLDATREEMVEQLMEKLGIDQTGVISMAISQMAERELPPKRPQKTPARRTV